MRYYKIGIKFSKALGVADLTGDIRYHPKGTPVADWEPLTFTVKTKHFGDGQPNLDHELLFSERVKTIIDQLASPDDAIQWLPAFVEGADGSKHQYFILHIANCPDLINWPESHWRYIDNQRDVIVPIFRGEALNDHQVFTYCHGVWLFVSEYIKCALQAAKCTGVELKEIRVTGVTVLADPQRIKEAKAIGKSIGSQFSLPVNTFTPVRIDETTVTASLKDQYAYIQYLIQNKVTVDRGMASIVGICRRLYPHSVWDAIAKLDYQADLTALSAWLTNLLSTEPPQKKIKAYYFGLYTESADEGSYCRLYLCGTEQFDPDDDSGDWACSPAYWPKKRYADSQVLRSISRLLRENSKTPEDHSNYIQADYLLCLGYATLATMYLAQTIQPELWLVAPSGNNISSRAIAVGFDEGNILHIGMVTRQGWQLPE